MGKLGPQMFGLLNPAGSGAEVMKYRFNWNFPILFSPHNPKKLYAGSNHLHVTTNEGQSWKTISPDLTRNDPETIKSSGGAITQDNTGAEFYANIFAIAESKEEEDVIWTGSDDGLIQVTRDGGKNWDNVTPKGSPKLNMMNCIDVDPHTKGGAYVAATSYKFGDYTPYLYKTTDYGKTWKKITNGIPSNHYTRAIRVDPVRKGLLYAGTEWGMYVSFDDGANWQPMQLNLPIVSIRDLHIKDNTLIAATHGRSFWMIDDLGPIQQLSKEITMKSHYLFEPKPAYRMAQSGGWGSPNYNKVGKNHANGVLFNFFVKDFDKKIEEKKGKKKVTLEIKDMDGNVIQTFTSDSKDRKQKLKVEAENNQFVWNMRYPGFKEFDGMVLYSSPNRGPKAVPGNYTATLTVDGKSEIQSFEITKDPRLKNTDDDYRNQLNFLLQVRNKVSEAHEAMTDIKSIRDDVNYFKNKLDGKESYDEVVGLLTSLEKEMSVIEKNIHMTSNQSRQDPLNFGIRVNNRLAFLLADQQRGDFPPTDQAEEVLQELTAELNGELFKLDKLLAEKIKVINEKGKALGVQIISDRINRVKNP